MFTPGLFSMFRQVYSDTVLPEPVGPVTRIMPYGTADGIEQALFFDRLVAQRIDAQLGAARVENPDHDFFAEQRRQAC